MQTSIWLQGEIFYKFNVDNDLVLKNKSLITKKLDFIKMHNYKTYNKQFFSKILEGKTTLIGKMKIEY